MKPRGFTLVEVVVALVIASGVVLLAHQLLLGIADGTRRLSESREALDRDANARRLLTELAGSIDISESAGGFDGRSDRVSLATWHLATGAQWRRSRVLLERTGSTVVVVGLVDRPVVLLDGAAGFELDYLTSHGSDAAWIREWISPVSAPLAIRLRVMRGAGTGMRPHGTPVDTVLLVVGTRG